MMQTSLCLLRYPQRPLAAAFNLHTGPPLDAASVTLATPLTLSATRFTLAAACSQLAEGGLHHGDRKTLQAGGHFRWAASLPRFSDAFLRALVEMVTACRDILIPRDGRRRPPHLTKKAWWEREMRLLLVLPTVCVHRTLNSGWGIKETVTEIGEAIRLTRN